MSADTAWSLAEAFMWAALVFAIVAAGLFLHTLAWVCQYADSELRHAAAHDEWDHRARLQHLREGAAAHHASTSHSQAQRPQP
jgi:hypothetical protein